MMTDGRKEVSVSPADGEGNSGLLFGGATHFVQSVKVEVRVAVEMMVVTSSVVLVPEVTVLVTGHVVKVV
jgi:anti-sigma regulatory factor (Ser/Thr protein kinase)